MNSALNNSDYSRMMITPEMAKEWLETKNYRNRKISDHLVDRLSQAINKGQWIYNGQPIIFDSQGNLIDGQHRLSAIAISGCTVESLVVSDVNDSKAFICEDDGKKRTLGDNLNSLGFGHADAVAAIGHIFYQIYHCRDLGKFRWLHRNASHLEMVEFIEQTPHISEAAHMALKHRRLCHVSIMGAALTTFMLINEHLGRDFYEMFTEDIYAYRNHPVKKLKERFINDSLNSKGKLTRDEKLALIFKAWNNWHSGKAVKDLRWRKTGHFPIPKGWS